MFSAAAIDAWAWRLPFLLGAVLLPIGLWLRVGIEETPRFRAEQAGHTCGLADLGTPFGMMAKAFGFTILWTVAYYVMLTYLPTFTQKYAGLTPTGALWSNTVALVVLAAAIPVMGALSDRIGRKPLLLTCCLGFVVLAYPGFLLMLSGLPAYGVALVQIGFNLVIACFLGPRAGGAGRVVPDAVAHVPDVGQLRAGGGDLRRLRAVHRDMADPDHRHADRADLLPDRVRVGIRRDHRDVQGNRVRATALNFYFPPST